MKKKIIIMTGSMTALLILIGILLFQSTPTRTADALPDQKATSTPASDLINTQMANIEKLQQELQNPDLSPEMHRSLSEKLENAESLATQIMLSAGLPAPKNQGLAQLAPQVTDPPFRSGLFPGGDSLILPYRVHVNNYWQLQTEEGYLQIVAGESPDDPQRGALYILQTNLEKTTSTMRILYGPAGSQSLTLLQHKADVLSLKTESGEILTFGLAELDFIAFTQ